MVRTGTASNVARSPEAGAIITSSFISTTSVPFPLMSVASVRAARVGPGIYGRAGRGRPRPWKALAGALVRSPDRPTPTLECETRIQHLTAGLVIGSNSYALHDRRVPRHVSVTRRGTVFRRRSSGPARGHTSYGSFVSFEDPDGNGWLVQEITTRLRGR